MDQGEKSISIPIDPVDPTRTLAFSSSQALSGQGGGESPYEGDDIVGEVMALHFISSPTVLDVSRNSANEAAQWSSTVLQIEP
jgi:hypothetical protein